MSSSSYQEYRRLIDGGQAMEAARLAENEYIQGGSTNSFWLNMKASALNKAGMHEQALNTAQEALNIHPGNPYSVLAAADALREMNQYDESLEYYRELVENPKLRNAAEIGVLKCMAGMQKWKEMLEFISNSNLPRTQQLKWSVKALTGSGRLEEAAEKCKEWLNLSPDNPVALWELTEIEVRLQGIIPVRKRMGRLARIPSRPPIYKEIYASLCRRTGEQELAVRAYSEMSRSGSRPRIERKRAFVLAKSGREDEAIPLMEELLKQNPGDVYVHSAYQAACGRVGRLKQALEFYENLLNSHPEQKRIYGHIKRIKSRMG